MCSLWLIIGKAGLSFEGELVCRRSCMLCRARGAALVLSDELSAVVWSLAESWLRRGDEPLDRVL